MCADHDGDDERFTRAVRPGRNPFELWIAAACVLTGLLAFPGFHLPREGVVDRFIPAAATLWYLGLLLGGGVTLLGTVPRASNLRRVGRLLAVERAGIGLLAGLLVGYGGAVVAVSTGAPAGVLLVALGGACVARFFQIQREVSGLRAVVRRYREVISSATEVDLSDDDEPGSWRGSRSPPTA